MSHIRKKLSSLGKSGNYVQSTSVMFKLTPAQKQELQDAPLRALKELTELQVNLYALKTILIRLNYASMMSPEFEEAKQMKEILSRAISAAKDLTNRQSKENWVISPTESFLIERGLLLANKIDEHSTRPEQFKVYVKSLEIVERNKVFRF